MWNNLYNWGLLIEYICIDLDELSWDAINKGNHMMDYLLERYRKRFECYQRELLANKIYCTRVYRVALKEKGISLLAKPLGRPSAVKKNVSPEERNPIEGNFGQAKTAYGLNLITKNFLIVDAILLKLRTN